ncbi:ATP-binding cassette domain-containing protein [Modestobacter sp. Leaf380]|uniref:ABC transporter ATP-binding protein n=1 Tax=Modestobacter sp. Leaf380 TaxID=1736356 RepID=UPI0009E6B19D
MTREPLAALSVSDLTFRYSRNGEDLFAGLTHRFVPGSVTALTGESGRGKSTLLYILGLLLTPSSGVVRVLETPSSDLSDAQRSRIRARSIGFVFQDAVLEPSRSILSSVCEPALYSGTRSPETRDRAMELLTMMGVDHRATHRPGEISGGQAQRVAICRALINDPKVVLADEPTGNLDRANTFEVLRSLRAAASTGRTIVIATHDPFVVNQSDQTLTL